MGAEARRVNWLIWAYTVMYTVPYFHWLDIWHDLNTFPQLLVPRQVCWSIVSRRVASVMPDMLCEQW